MSAKRSKFLRDSKLELKIDIPVKKHRQPVKITQGSLILLTI